MNSPFLAAAARLHVAPLIALVKRARIEETVHYETARWADSFGLPQFRELDDWTRFAWFVIRYREFRNLLYYRLRAYSMPVVLIARTIWRPEPTLFLDVPHIGRGLVIHHGFATIVTAESVGEDCWINQQVTVGYGSRGRPTIGDRVDISAGAIVFGPISIGDDARIGANATVMKDVAPGETMVAAEAVTLSEARQRARRSSRVVA